MWVVIVIVIVIVPADQHFAQQKKQQLSSSTIKSQPESIQINSITHSLRHCPFHPLSVCLSVCLSLSPFRSLIAIPCHRHSLETQRHTHTLPSFAPSEIHIDSPSFRPSLGINLTSFALFSNTIRIASHSLPSATIRQPRPTLSDHIERCQPPP